MKYLVILLCLIPYIVLSASAMDFTAPTVPSAGAGDMPLQYDSFGDGLWSVIRMALGKLQPSLASACGICLSLIAVCMVIGLVSGTQSPRALTPL